MKKGFLISLFASVITINHPVHAFQRTEGSSFVSFNLLHWQVREGGDDDVGELISPVGTANPTVILLNAPFKWNTGFRLGGGYLSPEQWDSVIYFTSYRTKAVNQVSAPGQVYAPYIGNFFQNNTNGKNNGPFYNASNLRWTIDYKIFDLELGRSFMIDNILTLRPFVGLKGGTINQRINTGWQGPNTLVAKVPVPITSFNAATENLTNYFTGIGPSFGLNTTWPIVKFSQGSFNLVGDFSAAFLWGLWRFSDRYQTDGPYAVTVTVDDVNGAAPMTRAYVGLEWIRSFSEKAITLSLGYEAQIWFDQIQFNSLNSGRLNDIMSLQGCVLNFSVNF